MQEITGTIFNNASPIVHNKPKKKQFSMTFSTFNIKRICDIADKISKKVLIQVEGATCSGKTSFVADAYAMLRQRKIDAMIIEEAATQILTEDSILFEQLVACPKESEQWKKCKLKLQQKVLSHQVRSLERLAENDTQILALMDRGGASTAYHTVPLLSEADKKVVERICRETARMSSQIVLLSPIGFLHRDSPRYQKNLDEIRVEYRGIKRYLNKWGLNYIEIPSIKKNARLNIGLRHILPLLCDGEQ